MCVRALPLLFSIGNGQKKCSAKSKQNVHGHEKEYYSAGKTDLVLNQLWFYSIGKLWIHYLCTPWFKYLGWGAFCFAIFYITGILFSWLIGFYISGMSMCVCLYVCIYVCVCVPVCLCVLSVCVPVSGCANPPMCLEIRGQGQDTSSIAFYLVFLSQCLSLHLDLTAVLGRLTDQKESSFCQSLSPWLWGSRCVLQHLTFRCWGPKLCPVVCTAVLYLQNIFPGPRTTLP